MLYATRCGAEHALGAVLASLPVQHFVRSTNSVHNYQVVGVYGADRRQQALFAPPTHAQEIYIQEPERLGDNAPKVHERSHPGGVVVKTHCEVHFDHAAFPVRRSARGAAFDTRLGRNCFRGGELDEDVRPASRGARRTPRGGHGCSNHGMLWGNHGGRLRRFRKGPRGAEEVLRASRPGQVVLKPLVPPRRRLTAAAAALLACV